MPSKNQIRHRDEQGNYMKVAHVKFRDDMLEKDGSPISGPTVKHPATFEEEYQIEKVQCEICHEIIGKIEMSNFKPPITGAMFFAKNEKNGYPPPFHPSLEWVDLRCPICRKRPFFSRNYITNEKNEKCGLTFECPICDQGFNSQLSLGSHFKKHTNQEA